MNDHWLVLYTKPRHEKKTANRLEQAGYEVYCPTVQTVRQWSDRKKKVRLPLFNGFFFIRVEESSRQEVFQYPGPVRYLFWLGKPAVVRSREIASIKAFLNDFDGVAEISTSATPQLGAHVRITSGVLEGQTGEVVRVKKNNRVMIRIDSIGVELVAELHGSQVTKD